MPITLVQCNACMRPSTSNMEHLHKKKCPRCGKIGDFEVFEEIEVELPRKPKQPQQNYDLFDRNPLDYNEPYSEFEFVAIGPLRARTMAITAYMPTDDNGLFVSVSGSNVYVPVADNQTANDLAKMIDSILKISHNGEDK